MPESGFRTEGDFYKFMVKARDMGFHLDRNQFSTNGGSSSSQHKTPTSSPAPEPSELHGCADKCNQLFNIDALGLKSDIFGPEELCKPLNGKRKSSLDDQEGTETENEGSNSTVDSADNRRKKIRSAVTSPHKISGIEENSNSSGEPWVNEPGLFSPVQIPKPSTLRISSPASHTVSENSGAYPKAQVNASSCLDIDSLALTRTTMPSRRPVIRGSQDDGAGSGARAATSMVMPSMPTLAENSGKSPGLRNSEYDWDIKAISGSGGVSASGGGITRKPLRKVTPCQNHLLQTKVEVPPQTVHNLQPVAYGFDQVASVLQPQSQGVLHTPLISEHASVSFTPRSPTSVDDARCVVAELLNKFSTEELSNTAHPQYLFVRAQIQNHLAYMSTQVSPLVMNWSRLENSANPFPSGPMPHNHLSQNLQLETPWDYGAAGSNGMNLGAMNQPAMDGNLPFRSVDPARSNVYQSLSNSTSSGGTTLAGPISQNPTCSTGTGTGHNNSSSSRPTKRQTAAQGAQNHGNRTQNSGSSNTNKGKGTSKPAPTRTTNATGSSSGSSSPQQKWIFRITGRTSRYRGPGVSYDYKVHYIGNLAPILMSETILENQMLGDFLAEYDRLYPKPEPPQISECREVVEFRYYNGGHWVVVRPKTYEQIDWVGVGSDGMEGMKLPPWRLPPPMDGGEVGWSVGGVARCGQASGSAKGRADTAQRIAQIRQSTPAGTIVLSQMQSTPQQPGTQLGSVANDTTLQYDTADQDVDGEIVQGEDDEAAFDEYLPQPPQQSQQVFSFIDHHNIARAVLEDELAPLLRPLGQPMMNPTVQMTSGNIFQGGRPLTTQNADEQAQDQPSGWQASCNSSAANSHDAGEPDHFHQFSDSNSAVNDVASEGDQIFADWLPAGHAARSNTGSDGIWGHESFF